MTNTSSVNANSSTVSSQAQLASSLVSSAVSSSVQSSKTQTSKSSSKASSKALSSTTASKSTPTQTKTKFEQFEDGMKAASLNLTNRNTLWAQMCGAIEGYGYDLGEGSIEIYRYKVNNEAYKEVVKNKAIFTEGIGSFPVASINGEMVLRIDNYNDKNKIIEIFNNIK